jgi:tetratricopeptide (TPR) repeat protein
MRLPLAGTILALFAFAASSVAAASRAPTAVRVPNLGWLEFESVLPVSETVAPTPGAATTISSRSKKAVPVTWVMGFPDTLAATDTRAILASLAPGRSEPLLPQGRLSRIEEQFLRGLRAFMDGNPQRTGEEWAKLRGQNLPPAIEASMRVNIGVLLALREQPDLAERAWIADWRTPSPATEGAWRNLLTLRMAQGRWSEANATVESMLAQNPRNRPALMAKSELLWQFRPESEWVDFLKRESEGDLAAPEIQFVYGEYLLKRGRPQDLAQAVIFFDKGLEKLPKNGRAWYLLAHAQFKQGYYYFAIDCLQNAGHSGYAKADFHELYARVLHTCCTGDEDPRAVKARAAAQELLEKGLAKDVHRRSMAQLLYTLYAQNLKPEAAQKIERDLWFHFWGPREDVPLLGDPVWTNTGIDARALRVKYGLYDLNWILALRKSDVYRGL